MKLKIDKEYEKLLPDLSEEEYQSLKKSIEENGIRVKLQVLKDGTIVCGHNRYKIANELGIIDIPHEIVDVVGEDEIQKYIIEDNLFRRQLNTAWKVQLAEKLEELEKKKAKQRQGTRTDIVVDLPQSDKGKSRDKVAEKLGISGSTYSRAKKVKESDPGLWKKTLDGKISVDKAYKETKKQENKKKHKELQEQMPTATKEKPKFGTKEWSDYSLNIYRGCEHNCRYCYARWNALNRYSKKPVKQKGTGMFPTTHDITENNVDKCIEYLEKQLAIGNKILITSKPHIKCIEKICSKLEKYKKQLLFRFTIGSISDNVLKFWEPNAPTYDERMACLRHAYKKGFETSVSCEPVLDKSISLVVCKALPYVTNTIWLGKMNDVGNRVNVNKLNEEELCYLRMVYHCNDDEFIIELYNRYSKNPKIKWKESYKKVLDLPEEEVG